MARLLGFLKLLLAEWPAMQGYSRKLTTKLRFGLVTQSLGIVAELIYSARIRFYPLLQMLTDFVYVNRQVVVQSLSSLHSEDEFRLSIPCSDGSEGMVKELYGEGDYVDYFTDFCCCFQDGFWLFKDW